MERHLPWIRLGIELVRRKDREVLTMRAWEGLSFAEIGRRLGLSENAARMRFSRAVTRLAEKVGRLRRGDFETVLGNGRGPA